jgi:hypothetical protein
MSRLELAEQALALANGKHVPDVSTTKYGYRRVALGWLQRVGAALASVAPKMYTAKGRSYEVETVEDTPGHVILYVGGMPVLYLNPETQCVHLVPNDAGEDIGLIYRGRAVNGVADCVHVFRDPER